MIQKTVPLVEFSIEEITHGRMALGAVGSLEGGEERPEAVGYAFVEAVFHFVVRFLCPALPQGIRGGGIHRVGWGRWMPLGLEDDSGLKGRCQEGVWEEGFSWGVRRFAFFFMLASRLDCVQRWED